MLPELYAVNSSNLHGYRLPLFPHHQTQDFADGSYPEIEISEEFGGMLRAAEEARGMLQPMVSVLTALNDIDAQESAATLRRLNSTYNHINENVALVEDGEEIAEELRCVLIRV